MNHRKILSLSFLIAVGGVACDDAEGPEPAGVLQQGLPKGQGGVIGNEDYCSYVNKCDVEEGDCDGDNHCVDGAYCLQNHGEAWGLAHLVDICVADTCLDGVQNGDETGVDCGPGCLPCGNGGDDYCTTANPCEPLEGDCDYDGHCLGDAYCAENVGERLGFRYEVDICVENHCANSVRDADETGVDCGGAGCLPCVKLNGADDFCTSADPCAPLQGDCDWDGHCLGDAYCAENVGERLGFRYEVDICLAAHCQDGVQSGDEAGVDCGGAGCLPCEDEAVSTVGSLGGIGDELLGDMVSDGSGNLVLAGSFRGQTAIAGRAMSSFGTTDRRDVFVTRMSAAGAPLWVHRFGGPISDGDNDVAVDVNRGLVAVVGNFHGTADFGDGRSGFTATSNGSSDIFVVLMDLNGELRWLRTYGGAGWDGAFDVNIDDGGNVNVVGGFEEQVDFGSNSFTSRGEMDGFVIRIRADNGSLERAKQLGGPARDVAFGIDSGSDRSLTIVGAFGETANLGLGEVSSAGARDGFVTRMNPYTFQQSWVRSFGGVREDILRVVTVDAANNSYAGGYFMRDVDFGGGARTAVGTDGVVLALDASGAYRWDYELPESSVEAIDLDRGTSMVAATGFVREETAALTGAASGGTDVFLLRLAGASGAQLEGLRGGSAANDRGTGVVAENHMCSVAGSYSGEFEIDGVSYSSAGQRDLFLFRQSY